MPILHFRNGTFGKEGTREDVKQIRETSEPWVHEGVELVGVKVDYFDGHTEELPNIQNNYKLK